MPRLSMNDRNYPSWQRASRLHPRDTPITLSMTLLSQQHMSNLLIRCRRGTSILLRSPSMPSALNRVRAWQVDAFALT